MDRLNWDKLRVFRAVAETGSISAAARQLGESTPTTSRRIDDLEKSLNAMLFKRTTRGVELTSAGHSTLIHANAIAESVAALQTEVSDYDVPAEGPITLVTGDGLGAHWIGPQLPKFHLAYPKIQLQMRVSDTPPDLLSGDADISIQFHQPKHQELIARKLGTLHYMCFASEDYLKTYGEPASLFELAEHRCIFHEGYVNQLEKASATAVGLSKLLKYALVTNSGSIMLSVCAGGGGVALLPSYVHTLDPRLRALSLSEVAPIDFWVTYSERIRRLNRGQIVIDWLKTIFDSNRYPWFKTPFRHPNSFDQGETVAADVELQP